MNIFKDTQDIIINSAFRQSGTDSNFLYFMSDLDRSIDWERVSVVNVSIPKSFYMVDDARNSFKVSHDNGATFTTLTLSNGNYTRESMKLELTNKLNTIGTYIYSITYNRINSAVDNGKYTFNVTNNITQPIFLFDNRLCEIIGFNQDQYVFNSNSLVSVNVANLNFENNLYLKSDITSANKGILCNITTTENQSYSYINYTSQNIHEYSRVYRNDGGCLFQFSLVNEFDQEMNLNGVNLVIVLRLYTINTIYDDFIKMITIKFLDQ